MNLLWVGGQALMRDLAMAALADHDLHTTAVPSLTEALDLIGSAAPSVVLIDDEAMDEDALVDAIRTIGRKSPTLPLVVLSASRAALLPVRALDAGARGYLGKDTPLVELVDSLQRVVGGATVLDRVASRNLMGTEWQRRAAERRPAHLTPVERRILVLAADGLLTKQIAQNLNLSPLTVKNHLARIRLRLGATDKAHVVATALRLGLLD